MEGAGNYLCRADIAVEMGADFGSFERLMTESAALWFVER